MTGTRGGEGRGGRVDNSEALLHKVWLTDFLIG